MTAPTAKRANTAPQPNPEAKRARCFDKAWRYHGASDTDVARTFRRIRREQKAAEAASKAKPAKPVQIIHAERIKGAK